MNLTSSSAVDAFRIVALANRFSAKDKAMSYGDRRAVEVLKQLTQVGLRVLVVTTSGGVFRRPLCPPSGALHICNCRYPCDHQGCA